MSVGMTLSKLDYCMQGHVSRYDFIKVDYCMQGHVSRYDFIKGRLLYAGACQYAQEYYFSRIIIEIYNTLSTDKYCE